MLNYDLRTRMLRNGVDDETGIDFDAHYQIGHSRVAWYLVGYDLEETQAEFKRGCDLNAEVGHNHTNECDEDENLVWCESELIENKNMIRAIMVGDDRVEIQDISDLTLIPREAFCGECGQMGCGHDGLDRSESDEEPQLSDNYGHRINRI